MLDFKSSSQKDPPCWRHRINYGNFNKQKHNGKACSDKDPASKTNYLAAATPTMIERGLPTFNTSWLILLTVK